MQNLSHDDLLKQLISLRDQSDLTLNAATDFFVKGVAGTMPRGRSVLLDFLRLRRLEPHDFIGVRHCEHCGLPQPANIRPEVALKGAYAGHASNEVIENILPRWQDLMALPVPDVSRQENNVLYELLIFIADTTDAETPGQLEKRIAQAGILPNTEKYKRYGILQTLAECGILPNALVTPLYEGSRAQEQFWDAHRKLKGNARSDIVLPFAGWRGDLGVNMDRYREIFATGP